MIDALSPFSILCFHTVSKTRETLFIPMKNPIGRNYFRLTIHALLSAVIVTLFAACKTDSTDTDMVSNLIGTWNQQNRTVDGTNTLKDSTRLLLQINANKICILCDSTNSSVKANTIVKRSGWSYEAGLFNLAIDMPASWTVTTSSSTLQMERFDFKSDGTISRTVLQYKRVGSIEIK